MSDNTSAPVPVAPACPNRRSLSTVISGWLGNIGAIKSKEAFDDGIRTGEKIGAKITGTSPSSCRPADPKP